MGKVVCKNKKGTQLLTNKLGKFERLNQEEWKILINGTVQGLAPVLVEQGWKKQSVHINCTGWYPLTAYMNNNLDAETALSFVWGTLRIVYDCERYGLRMDKLCWDPSQIFVDSKGVLTMVYWPVVTLDQSAYGPLQFYYSFYPILSTSGIDPQILSQYYGYFYQRNVFDFTSFYQLVQSINERWRMNKHRQRKEREKEEHRESIQSGRPKMLNSVWLERVDTHEKIQLDRDEVRIGRDKSQCAMALADIDGLSRRHALIVNRNNQYYIKDLGSKNGTFLEDIRLEPHSMVKLSDGSALRFGNTTFLFHKKEQNGTSFIHQM